MCPVFICGFDSSYELESRRQPMRRWHIVEVTKVEKNMFKITTPSDFMLKA
jgi:hypothetical protein